MRKLSILLILLMVTIPVHAGMIINRLIPATSATCAFLHSDPVQASGVQRTFNARELGCFVTYDESEVGGGLSLNITALRSWNGTDWATCAFYDFERDMLANTATASLRPMHSLTSDATYYFWFDPDSIAPYTKVVVDAIGADADDNAEVKAYLISNE